MLKTFQEHIRNKQLFGPGQTFLLAVSAGPDSVVLAHLLKESGISFALAHCNFKLRGKDSDADERFCNQLAKKLEVDLYTRSFDAIAVAKKTGQSIQMAARALRYAWFGELLSEKKYAALVTAHHAGDAVETVLINLLRGTGIKGLRGIPEKTENLVRPLLPFTKTELLNYAAAEKIRYREDKSNLESKYERNFLRLKVIPLLRELQPQLDQIMLGNLANFREESCMLEALIAEKLKGIIEKKGPFIYLDKTLLYQEKNRKTLLHAALSPFGFNASQVEDIDRHIGRRGLVGKVLSSVTHELTIDRLQLVVREKSPGIPETVVIPTLQDLKKVPYLGLSPLKQFSIPGDKEVVLETSRLIFPLTIRSKSRGDRFRPFGMRGFKLLSDFLTGQKLNNFEKENCRLLVNGNEEIIWVLGQRSDERYRVKTTSKDLIKLKLIG